METVNRALDTASHAIWGDTNPQQQQHGDEPLSGVQGQGKATDPYDAGNRDIQPGAPSTDAATATVVPADPTGNNPNPLSPAMSEELEPQLGSGSPGNGSAAFASANIPSVPDEPPVGTDPLSADASALSSSLNRVNNTVPEGRRVAGNPFSSDVAGMESTTGVHSGLGQAERTSVNPTMVMAGGIGGGGALAGSSAGSRESAAGLGDSGKGQSFEQRAQGASGGSSSSGGGGEGGGGGGGGDEQPRPGYTQEPEVNVSKETLKGPQSPAPRPEYNFEKEMDAGKIAKESTGDAKPPAQSQPRHSGAMSKMKERLHIPHHK